MRVPSRDATAVAAGIERKIGKKLTKLAVDPPLHLL
jgi:hypothetical protein